MPNWADDAAAKFEKQESEESAKQNRAHQMQAMLEQQGPQKWNELCQWLRQEITKFNEKVGRDVLVAPSIIPDKLDIFAKLDTGQRDATVRFDSSASTISYQAMDHDGGYNEKDDDWQMSITAQNTLAVKSRKMGVAINIEAIGGAILNGLMNQR